MEPIKRTSTTSDRLKEAMELRGKKQIDLVNETGMNRSSISRYLSGEFEPKQKAISKLAKSLDVTEMWLWGYDCEMQRTPAHKKNDTITDVAIRMQEQERFYKIIEDIHNLDDVQLAAVESVLAAFPKNIKD